VAVLSLIVGFAIGHLEARSWIRLIVHFETDRSALSLPPREQSKHFLKKYVRMSASAI
jgi:hypothetical protein